MKNNNLVIKLFLITLLIFSSCSSDFEEINTNEYKFNDATPEEVFAGVVKNTLDLVGGVMNDQIFNTENLSLQSYSKFQNIKISVGKKNIGVLKIKK